VEAFNNVLEVAKKYDVSMADAAYILAISRIADAHEKLGLWP
jgi:glutamate dehydrogenase/leucine dehydrogenase